MKATRFNKTIPLLFLFFFLQCSKNEEINTPLSTFNLRTEVYPENTGNITPAPGVYKEGIIKTVYARPEPGYMFDHWEGIINGLDNPCVIAFYVDHDIRAVFKKDTLSKRVVAGGNGKGINEDQFDYPTGIALNQAGDIFISDMHNHRIQKWKRGANKGTTVAGGYGFGSHPAQLDTPGNIVLDKEGSIYITDSGNHRIQKWKMGDEIGETVIGHKGGGSGLDQLDTPFGIALDVNGDIYVSEINNHRVTKWKFGAASGEVVAGGNGEGNGPNQLAYPLGICIDNEQNLYIADSYNHRIQLWKPGAKKGITLIEGKKLEDGYHFFSGVTLANKNTLIISDYDKKNILRYHLNENSLDTLSFNSSDVSLGLNHPYQVAVDALGDLIITDAKNNRIQKWKPKSN